MPIARPASTVSRSTSRMPTYVLVTIGGMASRASATRVVPGPRPKIGISPMRRASEGSARPTLAMPTASSSPRPVWPMTRPSGSATAVAASDRGGRDQDMLQQPVRDAVVPAPVRRVAEPGHDRADVHQPALDPGPRCQRALEREQAGVGDQREQDRQAGPDVDPGREVELVAQQDQLAQPALADDRADGHQADGRHGRHPDAGHDDRQGQRQLDPPEQGAAGEAHARAASITSAGTPSRPATMFRTRMSSV